MRVISILSLLTMLSACDDSGSTSMACKKNGMTVAQVCAAAGETCGTVSCEVAGGFSGHCGDCDLLTEDLVPLVRPPDLYDAPVRYGDVGIYSYSYSVNGTAFSGGDYSVGFISQKYNPGTTCSTTTYGTCTLTDCQGDLNGAQITNEAVGDVEIFIKGICDLSPDSQNIYHVVNDAMASVFGIPLFQPGDPIKITIGTASPVMLVAPAEPTLTSPVIPATGPLVVASSSDFTVGTTGGTQSLIATLSVSVTATHAQSLTCTGGANSLTIGKAALQQLAKGSAQLKLGAVSFSDLVIGAGYATHVHADTPVLKADGSQFGGTAVTIQ